jgi:transcriptional regulator with XRE-family HTH domain
MCARDCEPARSSEPGPLDPRTDEPWITSRPLGQTGDMDRAALADFLRRRRETLDPADVGLSKGSRRRTQGLRREEVALLASMSTDYYSRLEQQRGPEPSESMLNSIARALRLSSDERDYLLIVGGYTPLPHWTPNDHVSPALLRVLDRLHDTPAQVINDLNDTLVQNHMAVALLGEQTHYSGLRRSMTWRWFCEPESREIYPTEDHEHQTRLMVASLRTASARRGNDARISALIVDLLQSSEEFSNHWKAHDVVIRRSDRKRISHPTVGVLNLECQILVNDDAAQRLLIFTADHGSRDYEMLKLLATVGTQTFIP